MTDYSIRAAEPGDREAIREFTTGTFSWGDYVADVFDDWLADEDAQVSVVTIDGRPVAVARAVMLSTKEAWLHGARVHPDHRRRGLASRLNEHLSTWAAGRGALVVRLLIESWNEPAQKQVEALGYRHVADWVSATRGLGSEPDPATNGGRRVRGDEQLAVATPAEIEPAWATWSASDLARAGRGLFPLGWLLRRLTREDMDEAVRERRLLHGPSGWIMALDDDGTMFVPFVAAAEDDLYRLIRAGVDRADRHGFERMRVMVPATGPMEDALKRGGFDLAPDQVWARPLG